MDESKKIDESLKDLIGEEQELDDGASGGMKKFSAYSEKSDKSSLMKNLDDLVLDDDETKELVNFILGLKIKKEDHVDVSSGAIPKTTKKQKAEAGPELQKTVGAAYSFPKLSSFSGEGTKTEVSWETFRFEIESLVKEKIFSDEQIMLGIRRAVKGTASDIIRRLGTGVDVKTVIRKLNSTFGSIENAETVMRKLYSCSQGKDRVSTYAIRLEDFYAQAVELGAIKINDEHLLKQILYQGLNLDLKHIAQYKYDTIDDYDRFKIELRKLEADMKKPEASMKTTCNVAQKVEEKKELSYIETTLKELKEKIEKLEQAQSNPQYQSQRFNRSYRRPYGFRGNRGQANGRGRGQFTQSRPLAANNFRGSCFNCGERNHMARDCEAKYTPKSTIICYNCGEEGHLARQCFYNQDDSKPKNLNA